MHAILKKDLLAGLFMTLLGAGVVFKSTDYSVGTLRQMGPGTFPFLLGILMAFVGTLITAGAVTQEHESDNKFEFASLEWRAWFCILGGPILFIVFGNLFGLVPAAFSCVFVSALGDRTATLKGSLALAAIITVAGTLLFSVVLKMPLPPFRWGF